MRARDPRLEVAHLAAATRVLEEDAEAVLPIEVFEGTHLYFDTERLRSRVEHPESMGMAVRFDHLVSKIDPRSGQVVEENPSYLRTGDAAIVRFVPLQPVSIEVYSDFPQLGRFALRDMGTTIGAGVILEIEE